jgi:predicted neuraminidase
LTQPVCVRHLGWPRASGRQALSENALWETDLERVFRWNGVIQPTLWESVPGYVHMLPTSTRGRVYRSHSHDGGSSWCAAYATSLPHNNSGPDLAHLGGGHFVLAHNPGEGERSNPAIIAAGGYLHVAYTCNL